MSDVLERIHQLMALATSPNEHEARNAALLAVRLVSKHGVVLSLPTAAQRKKSSKNVKRVADPPEKIVAPLGGECIQCGGRYRADTTIWWLPSGGGLHLRCFDDWARGKR